MRSSLLAACVALLSAPVAHSQAPPRGAWNGLTEPEMADLQWTCADGSAQVRTRWPFLSRSFAVPCRTRPPIPRRTRVRPPVASPRTVVI